MKFQSIKMWIHILLGALALTAAAGFLFVDEDAEAAPFIHKRVKKATATTTSAAAPAPAAHDPSRLVLDPATLVEIVGPIEMSALDIADAIHSKGIEQGKVDLFINSPGGVIFFGMQIINAVREVRARGGVVRCVVGTLAASMAFQILAECTERYAFPYSLLLFHRPSGAAKEGSTAQTFQQHASELQEQEAVLLSVLEASLGMDPDLFRRSLDAEKMWYAYTLQRHARYGWLTLIQTLDGVSRPFSISQEQQQ